MKASLLVLTLTLLLLPKAYGQEGGACKKDVEQYCAAVPKGHGEVMKCLKDHQHELSSECKAQHEVRKEQRHETKQACKEDIAKHCQGVEPGKGRMITCLKQHEAEVSAACKKEMAEMKAMFHHKKDKE